MSNPDRLEFLLSLRADPEVRRCHTDDALLRSTVDDLQAYLDAWNRQLQQIYLRDRRDLLAAHDRAASRIQATGESLTALQEDLETALDAARIQQRPTPLSDIREIAVAVATQRDCRHPLLRRLIPFNPVAARHRELRQRYKTFVDAPGAARTEMERAIANDHLPTRIDEMYDILQQAANDLLRREVLLRDLASAGRSLAESASPPGLLERKRATPAHDLSPIRIRRISGYFRSQADIEGIRFRTLHLASQRFYHLHYPAQRTERIHKRLVRNAMKTGFSRFQPTAVIEPPKR